MFVKADFFRIGVKREETASGSVVLFKKEFQSIEQMDGNPFVFEPDISAQPGDFDCRESFQITFFSAIFSKSGSSFRQTTSLQRSTSATGSSSVYPSGQK